MVLLGLFVGKQYVFVNIEVWSFRRSTLPCHQDFGLNVLHQLIVFVFVFCEPRSLWIGALDWWSFTPFST